MFDISTLVTDRTQADVQAWNDKGTYNPSDLNRVTHAMEYLVERIRSYGYAVKHEKVKVPHQPQKGKNRLPAGYTELEYIESTGTQYFNTGFKPNNNTRVLMDFENMGDYSGMTTSLCPFFGARNGSSSAVFALWIGTKTFPQYGNVAYNKNGNFTVNLNTRLTYDFNKNVITIGDSKITCTTATFTTNYEMCLLTINNFGTIESRRASGKLYSCKIYNNGALVRDFVPCKNASGTVGLYDLVNGVFYANAGTGVFTAGAEVELLPVEILDDYTWYHSDIPQTNELNAYLQNVGWLREAMVLLPNTPEVPCDMEGFTFAEANDIEQILVNIETIINLMLSSIIYSGEIFSGEVI